MLPGGGPAGQIPKPPVPQASCPPGQPSMPRRLPTEGQKASCQCTGPLTHSTALPGPGPRTQSGHREPMVTAPWGQRSPCQPGAEPREPPAAAAAAAGPFPAGRKGWDPGPSAPWLLLGWRKGQQEAETEQPGQVGGQGHLEMINSGSLQCRAHISLTSAAQLTPPGPAVPSGISHTGPGPDSVPGSQLRSLLQEVLPDTLPVGAWTCGPGFRPPPLHRAGHCL